MRVSTVLAVLITTLLALLIPLAVEPSYAACGVTVTPGAEEPGFNVTGANQTCESTGNGGGSNVGTGTADGTWFRKPVCTNGGLTLCDVDGQATCEDGTPMELIWFVPVGGTQTETRSNCPTDPAEPDPGPTIEDITRAFREIPLPSSDLRVQPVDGQTLINFDTNFFTRADSFNRSVTLLGRQVDFRIRPTTFRWVWGDGATKTTRTPGSSYPDLDVTHRYTAEGTFTPTVATTWEADYRVSGGTWAAVPGTVTRTGDGADVQVRTATPLLVGNN